MSNTIAEKLVILSDGLELIDQEKQYQTDLILNLQDSLEQLSTPIPQSAPLITINNATGIITASVTQEQGGYVAPGTLQTQAEAKYYSQSLVPQNIKSGVKILGVTGTMSSGIDTSDATATAEHLRKDTTAYVNGQKITGTAEEPVGFYLNNIVPSSTEIDVYPDLDSEKTYWISGGTVPSITVPLEVFGDAAAANVRKDKTFTSSSGFNVTGTMPNVTHAKPSISINDANGIVTASHTTTAGYITGGTTSNTLQLSVQGATTITPSTSEQTAVAAGFYTKGAVKVAGDADLTAANIRNGVNIFNVAGTYTSDATADATHILKDKIAYSKGSKITGTMTNRGAVTPGALAAGGSYTIPAGYHNGSGKVTAANLAGQTSGTAAASHIVSGKTAWVNGSKVTGTMEEIDLEVPILNFKTDTAVITYDISQGYVSEAQTVTSNHPISTQDATTITPTKAEQTAVGQGTYTLGAITVAPIPNEYITTTDATAVADQIMYPATAYVKGSKITGTLQDYDDDYINMDSVTFDGDINLIKTLDEGIAIQKGGILKTYIEGSVLGNAAVANVLSGKTFTSENGLKLTGTMTNQGTKTVSLNTSATSYTIPQGYHSGSGKVSITTEQKTVTPSASLQTITPSNGKVLSRVKVNTDINLKAENIKSGVTIFGVTGTYSAGGGSNITDLTNTTWLFHHELDAYWHGVRFPWNLNFTSNNTNYTQIRYEDNSDDSNDVRQMYYNTLSAYTFDTGLHSWYPTDATRTIHITGGADVNNTSVIAALQQMATLVNSNDLEALGVLCEWEVMTNQSSYPVVTIYNRHPTYYLKCTIYNDNDRPASYDDGNGTVIGDGNIIVSPDDWATFIVEEELSTSGPVYIDNVRWTKNV